ATGELGDATTSPKHRVSYVASYYDAADRLIATVNVGTNGGTAYTRPGAFPSRSDTTLVSTYFYDTAGRLFMTVDPHGIGSEMYYDALGRVTKTVQAYIDGTASAGDDKITQFTYDPLDHQQIQAANTANPQVQGEAFNQGAGQRSRLTDIE